MLPESGLIHQACRLLPRPAKNERPPRFVNCVGEILEGLQTCGVNCGHVSQAKNNYGRQFPQLIRDFVDFVRGAEKKWSVNAENCHVGRNFLVLQNVDVALPEILLRDLRHRRGICNFANEYQGR